jgi:hypothetical protein
MIFWFVPSVACFYTVPCPSQITGNFPIYTAESFSPPSDTFILLVDNSSSSISGSARSNLEKAVYLFPQLRFGYISLSDFHSVRDPPSVILDGTSLIFYENRVPQAQYSFPNTTAELLTLLEIIAEQVRSDAQIPKVFDRQALLRSLGRSEFSLVYPSSATTRALAIGKAQKGSLGGLNMIPIENATAVGLLENQFYLFRRADLWLEPFDPNTTDIAHLTTPDFKRFTLKDVLGNAVVGLAGELTKEAVTALAVIGRKQSRFSVGVFDESDVTFANLCVAGTLGPLPALAIFNWSDASYVVLPEELRTLAGKDGRVFGEAVVALLSGEPQFVSVAEPVPTGPSGPVAHLVNSTYMDFAFNQMTHSVILYVGGNVENTRRWIDAFTEAATQNALPSVAFGMINVTLNPLIGPDFYSLPQIQMYPRNEKGPIGWTFFGRLSSSAILSFVGRYATGETDPRETERDRICEILQIMKVKDSFSGERRAKAEARLAELRALVNFAPISDEL